MNSKQIGVLALQGDVFEHRQSLKKAGEKLNLEIAPVKVKKPGDVENLDAILIPGGESTTIGRLLSINGLDEKIIQKAEDGLPILGTCAGMVLLSKEVDNNPFVLGLMDMQVIRNAFGRQRESFETELQVDFLENPYHAVFIRSPAIGKAHGNCSIHARLAEGGVIAVEDNLMALSFHPELTTDTKVQEYFLKELVQNESG